MLSASKMSDAIRMKRKKVKEDGVENMIDTAPGPQMNPQDIYNMKMDAQVEDTIDSPHRDMAPSDPADGDIKGTSQSKSDLKSRMARVRAAFNKL